MSHTTKNQMLKDLRIGHTDFQVTQYIVRQNGITDWGCYQQALRELFNRLPTLNKMREEYRSGGHNAPAEHTLHETERETTLFFRLAHAYRARLPKELTTSVVRALEADFHLAKLRHLAYSELASQRHLSVGTVSAIMALPQELRADFRGILNAQDQQLQSYAEWIDKHLTGLFTETEIETARQITYEPEALLL
jgi:hypothetical protein